MNTIKAEVLTWLAGALVDATPVLQEWRENPLAISAFPLGVRFDAVRVSQAIVHSAANSTADATVYGFLSEYLQGAVIRDLDWYYMLVPARTTQQWHVHSSRCLGRGSWLEVPHLERRAGPRSHWVVLPQGAADVCDPQRVADLVRIGHERILARPARKSWPM